MKPIIVVTDEEQAPKGACFHFIDYPNTLSNPLFVNTRWDEKFIQNCYRKYLHCKIRDRDEQAIYVLDLIASQVMDGKQVVLIQKEEEVHGEILAEFIKQTIDNALNQED